MLRIYIKDFAIIEHAEIEFKNGFTALTGETGAGKSIIIDAIQVCMGERADPSVIRSGSGKSDISLTFRNNTQMDEFLTENCIDISDDETIVIRRVVEKTGRSKCWINGTQVSLKTVKEASLYLMDIHGQHGWQTLMTTEGARIILDSFLPNPAPKTAPAWHEWKSKKKEFLEAEKEAQQKQERTKYLEALIERIEALNPKTNEWNEVEANHARAMNAKNVIGTLDNCKSSLSNSPLNIITAAFKALNQMDSISSLEPTIIKTNEMLQQAIILLEETDRDITQLLRKWRDTNENAPEIEHRYQQWKDTAKLVNCRPESLTDELRNLQAELYALQSNQQAAWTQQSLEAAEQKLMKLCNTLTNYRETAAEKLQNSVSELLQGLGMEGSRFRVHLYPNSEPTAYGMENVEFMISTNPGTALVPVNKIASGGELSRIALAITVSTTNATSPRTIIFDEIDAGIGGAVAKRVGSCLKKIGEERQVLAVTHLAQVAASADHHIRATKISNDDQAKTILSELNPDERIEEVARMLDGHSDSATSRNHAKEILQK